jgi:hypothetical protein
MNAMIQALRGIRGVALLVVIALCGTGCGTLSNGRGWGQDAIYPVHWDRVKTAAKNAVCDPVTLITAGGALLFAIDDWDHQVSDWAADKTPIFGSNENADDWSDVFNTTLEYEAYGTVLLTPSGEDPLDWAFSKARGFGVEYLALKANSAATSGLKSLTDRERPDGSNTRSMPSGHASNAFGSARLANRNIDYIEIPQWARTTFKTGNYVMASATAWARVEARKHYPSDVLVGACLGNIVTTFIHDAFMNLPEDSSFSFYLEPSPKGVFGAVSWDF